MPYWTRATVHERLVQLIEDVQLTADDALALDTAVGGSAPDPAGPWGPWKTFAMALAGEEQVPPAHIDRLRAWADRMPHADDSDLGAARDDVLWLYQDLHLALPQVEPWVHPSEPHRAQALALRIRLADGEDEAHRVLTGLGDLRRSERRQGR